MSSHKDLTQLKAVSSLVRDYYNGSAKLRHIISKIEDIESIGGWDFTDLKVRLVKKPSTTKVDNLSRLEDQGFFNIELPKLQYTVTLIKSGSSKAKSYFSVFTLNQLKSEYKSLQKMADATASGIYLGIGGVHSKKAAVSALVKISKQIASHTPEGSSNLFKVIDSVYAKSPYSEKVVVDVDTKNPLALRSVLDWLKYNTQATQIITVPTVKGHQVITDPFNQSSFNICCGGKHTVHKNGLTLLYTKLDPK